MLLVLLAATLPEANAKDLRSRVGVGLHQQFVGVSALSVRYGLPTAKPTSVVQVEVDAGVAAAASAPLELYAGGRLLYSVLVEDNLNVYLGAGAGYAQQAGVGAARVEPVLGAEFFLFGLENLGFSVEWGVPVDLGATWSVRTAPNAAVHYYF
jgi:hypothetical protein